MLPKRGYVLNEKATETCITPSHMTWLWPLVHVNSFSVRCADFVRDSHSCKLFDVYSTIALVLPSTHPSITNGMGLFWCKGDEVDL